MKRPGHLVTDNEVQGSEVPASEEQTGIGLLTTNLGNFFNKS